MIETYFFQKIISNEELLQKIDGGLFFGQKQPTLADAVRFLQENLTDWLLEPNRNQFILLRDAKGAQERFSNEIVKAMFDEQQPNSFWDKEFEKKTLWTDLKRKGLDFQISAKLLEGQWHSLSPDDIRKRIEGIEKRLDTPIVKPTSRLDVYNLNEAFLDLDWPDNEPIKCGYPMFDDYELIKKGCITTILGATSTRKSTFLLNFTHRFAKHKKKILYVILEGNIKRNIKALVAQLNDIENVNVERSHYNNEYLQYVKVAHQNYAIINVKDLDNVLKDKQFDIMILDYVTLLDANEQESLFLKGQLISQNLKKCAEDHNVAILTAAQTNRQGQDKIVPTHEDVGESHGITMAMDVMVGIIKYRRLDNQNKTALEIIKIRENPEHILESLEGKREFYDINYANKLLTPVDSTTYNRMVDQDMTIGNGNSKRAVNEEVEVEPITSTEIMDFR